MKALVFHKPRDVRVETVPDPVLQTPRDAILRVTSTSICGTDLHIYNGYLAHRSLAVLGHEFMGVVEEIGAEVRDLRPGDRVVAIPTGPCWRGEAPSGGQAQLVRIPFADGGSLRIPPELPDDRVLFLTDILPAAWSGIDRTELQPGETVAVFGCGPVGLLAQKIAWLRGAGRVIGVDLLGYRVEAARRIAGSEGIDAQERDPVEAIRDLTDGRGADVCIDAAGMEARGLRRRAAPLDQALGAVRRGGRVSVLGYYARPMSRFPIDRVVDQSLRILAGPPEGFGRIAPLLEIVLAGELRVDDIITHTLPLDQGAEAYRLFNEKKDRCVKVVLKPQAHVAPVPAVEAAAELVPIPV